MGKKKDSSDSSDKKHAGYLDLEEEKKKTGRVKDLPKSPNMGTAKKKKFP